MRNGIKIADMDTHVVPHMETLEKYVEPSFRSRLEELAPYKRTRASARRADKQDEQLRTSLHYAAIPYDRFPGTAPARFG